jgi:hypothetical protein
VTRYLVERYLPDDSTDEIREALVRLSTAAERMTAEGTPVRYLGSTLMRDDEACFCEFEAASVEVVAEANQRAGFAFARIVTAERVA